VSAAKAGLTTASHSITLAGADHLEVDLDLRATTRGGAQSEAPTLGTSATATKKAGTRSRVPLIAGLAVTGAAAVTTGFFGWLALRSKNTLSRDLDTYGISPNRVSEDRSRVRNYALITDIAAGTTLVAAGVTLYMALAHSGKETSEAARPQPRLAVTPTLNGVALVGGW
jgi:hypothetical protein